MGLPFVFHGPFNSISVIMSQQNGNNERLCEADVFTVGKNSAFSIFETGQLAKQEMDL